MTPSSHIIIHQEFSMNMNTLYAVFTQCVYKLLTVIEPSSCNVLSNDVIIFFNAAGHWIFWEKSLSFTCQSQHLPTIANFPWIEQAINLAFCRQDCAYQLAVTIQQWMIQHNWHRSRHHSPDYLQLSGFVEILRANVKWNIFMISQPANQ